MKAKLDEDLGNMEPAELEPAADTTVDNPEATESEVVDALPEVECSKMRVGTFCAILEGVIDDIEEEKASNPDPEVAEEPVTEKEIDEVAEPVIEQAVALAIVPASVRKMYQKLKAERLRITPRRAALLASAAHWVAEAVTEVSEDGGSAQGDPAYTAGGEKVATPIDAAPDASGEIADSLSQEDESILEGETKTTAYYKRKMAKMFGSLEGDTAVDDPAYNAGADKIATPIEAAPDASGEIADALSQEDESLFEGETKTTAYYKDKMHKLFGSLEGDISIPAEDIDAHDGDPINVSVDGGIDKASTACLRALAASAVAHRRATSQVSRRISGVLLNRMLHELRYTLPASFMKKYNVK